MAKKKKSKIIKGKKLLFPHNSERKYLRSLRLVLKSIRENTQRLLVERLPYLLISADQDYSNQLWSDFLDRIIDQIDLLADPSRLKAYAGIKEVGEEIAQYNSIQTIKSFPSELGVNIFVQEPWLATQLESFNEQGAALISSLSDDEISSVKQVVLRSVSEGTNLTTTIKDIQKRFSISFRHAKLIARDQTAKLNGSLTRLRQENLGIENYIWQTSGDDRVRKSHKVLDGMECTWQDPTVYRIPGETKWRKRSSIGGAELHIGQDFQCRCTSIPVLEE